MATGNEQLNNKITAATGAGTAVEVFQRNVKTWFISNQRKMNELLSEDEAKRLMIVFLRVASQMPKIMSCSMESVGNCLLQSAELGLYPGAMGECAYLPFGGILTFVPQYQGLTKLAYQGGALKSLNYGTVKNGDFFEWELGAKPFLRHKPAESTEDNAESIFWWATAENVYGGLSVVVKDKKYIEGIRKRSPGVKAGAKTPWDTDYDSMGMKTVIKLVLKPFPKSERLAKALELDNAAERPDLVKRTIVEVSPGDVVNINSTDIKPEENKIPPGVTTADELKNNKENSIAS